MNTRAELRQYDAKLAKLCHEVFGETELRYTKPATRLIDHLAGYNPGKAPQFKWPQRLHAVREEIIRQAKLRDRQASARP